MYVKTKAVIARLQAKRERILQAAIELADHGGLAAINVRDVAESADVAPGTVYTHYADLTELIAAVVGTRLKADLEAMRAGKLGPPSDALTDYTYSVRAYLHQHVGTRQLGRAVAAEPVYRRAIIREWTDRIAIIAGPDYAAIRATALYGAINAVLASTQRVDTKIERLLISMAVQAIGLATGPRERVSA